MGRAPLSEADGELCIGYLLDKSLPWNDRLAAVESLMWYLSPRASDALFQVLLDPTEEDWMRKEAAGSLGSIWVELGADYERLRKIPDRYIQDVLDDFPLQRVKLDVGRFADDWPRIAATLRQSARWTGYVDWLEGKTPDPPTPRPEGPAPSQR
jgi:hypothetical protein